MELPTSTKTAEMMEEKKKTDSTVSLVKIAMLIRNRVLALTIQDFRSDKAQGNRGYKPRVQCWTCTKDGHMSRSEKGDRRESM